MKSIIKEKLREIEIANVVKILYACESGSRAWGFASPDSDYDVRFIYVHPKEYYLGIDEQRDVIELPINDLLDINGWELRKALRLFRKSNGPIYEWLQSPIVYQSDSGFIKDITGQMPHFFSARAMMHHYLSMAKTVVDNELSGYEVKLKKFFYALRPVLACLWMIKNNEVPPMEFGKLRMLFPGDVNRIVGDLLIQKAQVDESYKIKPIMEIHRWLGNQIEHCEQQVPDAKQVASDRLNELFRKYLL